MLHLWSVARGLARNVHEYKQRLAAADEWRRGDLDGRGNLTQAGLVNFCAFFLKVCIDQVEFMGSLLEPAGLVERIRKFCENEISAKKLPRGTFTVLRELILAGKLERGKVADVTGYQERQSRSIVQALIKRELLVSASPRAPLKLAIPHAVVEDWFPRLYPPDMHAVQNISK